MGADNWEPCLNCRETLEGEVAGTIRALEKSLKDAYGTLPVDEFMALVGETREKTSAQTARLEAQTDRNEHTFREDWDIYGAEDGTVTIEYSGRCTTCGYGGTGTFTVPLKVQGDGQ